MAESKKKEVNPLAASKNIEDAIKKEKVGGISEASH
jgi:hypothetical protein